MIVPSDEAGRAVPKVQLRGVTKHFGAKTKNLEVLEQISIEAGAGEFISIIGPSGCGKSTMFNIITGLESPTAGDVLFDGETVTGAGDHFAYMPQKDLLFPWRRIIDNTTLGLEVQGMNRRAARKRAAPLFETFGLSGFENHYPWQLSGGMRQRAALLRTVVQERSVLLLDEPFGALDSLTRTDMQEWMISVWEQFRWTVLLITHDIREAILLSDRVYVLTARPASVSFVADIKLGRPRLMAVTRDRRFTDLENRLLEELRAEH